MLTHIVVWKYRADVAADIRQQHVDRLQELARIVPEVRSLSVGFDTLGLPRSYDTGLVATFDDHAGLDAYTLNPEHVRVAEFGRSISEHVASVDFT